MKSKKTKVAVGMSGGVDSSVAALLLRKAGYEVVGLFMKLWHDSTCSVSRENACCDAKAEADARQVAKIIGIKFYVVDAREPFKKMVTDYFINEYKNLRTPNPCVVCNNKIKFGWLLDFAEKLGCEFIATGHYARINVVIPDSVGKLENKELDPRLRGDDKEGYTGRDDSVRLLKGKGKKKDQSYFLAGLNQEQLSKIIFPLGEITKGEVRKIAKENKLPVFEKRESQEVCFIADNDYRGFLRRHLGEQYFKPGEIVNSVGNIIGRHEGLINYTIGQRKGINQISNSKFLISNQIPNPKSKTGKQALYVIGFDKEKNRLIVGEDSELFRNKFEIKDVNWNKGTGNEERGKSELSVKIRYGAEPIPCKIFEILDSRFEILDSKFEIQLAVFARAVTPGQSAVIYRGEEVVGSGTIV